MSQDDATDDAPKEDFDVKAALEEMVSRANKNLKVEVGRPVMPLDDLKRALFDPALPWSLRGFLVYHQRSAYERLCLENAGMKPATLWATHNDRRVRLMGVKDNDILISSRGDVDSKQIAVSLADLADFGPTK